MPALASTIFKIRAHSDFITDGKEKNILSFRKGQPFYALSVNYESGMYFVSTQYAVPFARTAVCGFVPMEYFHKVDLLSRDPPMKPNRRQSICHPAAEPQVQKSEPQNKRRSLPPNREIPKILSPISAIRVLSSTRENGMEVFSIKIVCGSDHYIIKRSTADVNALLSIVKRAFPYIQIGALAAPNMTGSTLLTLESILVDIQFKVYAKFQRAQYWDAFAAKDMFFNPSYKDDIVQGATTARRDSGISNVGDDSAQSSGVNGKRRNSAISKLASMVFGM